MVDLAVSIAAGIAVDIEEQRYCYQNKRTSMRPSFASIDLLDSPIARKPPTSIAVLHALVERSNEIGSQESLY